MACEGEGLRLIAAGAVTEDDEEEADAKGDWPGVGETRASVDAGAGVEIPSALASLASL